MQNTPPPPNEVIIIGAGPAGLACAMELVKAGRPARLIEKDSQVGGLAKTLRFQEGDLEFRTDLGPHRFFSKNTYLYDFIEDLLAEKWIQVPRHTRQFIDGKFYRYPVDAFQVFRNIGPWKSLRMAVDYVRARLQYGLLGKSQRTFEDYVVAHFGRAIAEFSMINYTEKIWGIPASEIHPDWASQRIKGLNLVSALKKTFFFGKAGEPRTMIDHFYYPQFGTGLIYETIARRLCEDGAEMSLNSCPTAIRHENGRITAVDLNLDGTPETVRPDILVESIPITHFLQLLQPPPPPEVIAAAQGLRWRAQVYLFITLDKPSVTPDNWIYFPNRRIPFGRISEMRNFSGDMSPPGKTSLFIEFFVFEEDEIWQMDRDELLDLVLPIFEDLGFFTRAEIRQTYLLRRSHVYPVYDLNYQENVGVIRDYLDRFENLIYIGRPGRFRYTNQDHSLEMGILAARQILEGRRPDFETVGAENEFFESGPIYEKRI